MFRRSRPGDASKKQTPEIRLVAIASTAWAKGPVATGLPEYTPRHPSDEGDFGAELFSLEARKWLRKATTTPNFEVIEGKVRVRSAGDSGQSGLTGSASLLCARLAAWIEGPLSVVILRCDRGRDNHYATR